MKLKLEHREKKKIEKKKPNPRAVLFYFFFKWSCSVQRTPPENSRTTGGDCSFANIPYYVLYFLQGSGCKFHRVLPFSVESGYECSGQLLGCSVLVSSWTNYCP